MANSKTDILNAVDFTKVDNWIFDLDDTLYSASTTLFTQIEIKIRDYLCEFLKVEPEEAFAKQKYFYNKFGTTLRGMMLEHDMPPEHYIKTVHDLNLDVLDANPELDRAIGRLPGKKFVFTNGSRGHGKRVTEKLGIAHHFEGFFGVRDAQYIPKPDMIAYHRMIERFDINPKTSALFEDSQKNLKPAKELGMATIWVRNLTDKITPVDDAPDFCDVVTEDLVECIDLIFNRT